MNIFIVMYVFMQSYSNELWTVLFYMKKRGDFFFPSKGGGKWSHYPSLVSGLIPRAILPIRKEQIDFSLFPSLKIPPFHYN